jgi:hypothetical protein
MVETMGYYLSPAWQALSRLFRAYYLLGLCTQGVAMGYQISAFQA